MIDLTKQSKAAVLAVLFNNSKAQGMSFMNYSPEPMSEDRAQKILDEFGEMKYFDYLEGRVMKIDLSGDQLDTRLYDRDNGEGAAERAISSIEKNPNG